jgi:hypothetical protein
MIPCGYVCIVQCRQADMYLRMLDRVGSDTLRDTQLQRQTFRDRGNMYLVQT